VQRIGSDVFLKISFVYERKQSTLFFGSVDSKKQGWVIVGELILRELPLAPACLEHFYGSFGLLSRRTMESSTANNSLCYEQPLDRVQLHLDAEVTDRLFRFDKGPTT